MSCIMFADRSFAFFEQSLRYFLRQDLVEKELLIIAEEPGIEERTVPNDAVRFLQPLPSVSRQEQLDSALESCRGRYIALWDCGDWIGANRLSCQAAQLERANAPGCVAGVLMHYSPVEAQAWELQTAPCPYTSRKTLFYDRNRVENAQVGASLFQENRALAEAAAPLSLETIAAPWYVTIVHRSSSATSSISGGTWRSTSCAQVAETISSDRAFYCDLRATFRTAPRREPPVWSAPLEEPPKGTRVRVPSFTGRAAPRASCLMPTSNRRAFVPLAIQSFLRQDYPERELIIIDDGTESVEDLVPQDGRIQYVRCRAARSIGTKRNLAAEMATGELLVCWDDDDWFASHRISRQAAPLLAKRYDLSVLECGYILDVTSRQFLHKDRTKPGHLFNVGAGWGTLAWTREWWLKGIRFPDSSHGEDVAFKEAMVQGGARVTCLPEDQTHLYVRHTSNTWKFSAEDALRDGWTIVSPPVFLPRDVLCFYGFAAEEAAPPPAPLLAFSP